ncbi:MAG: patatin family protein [Clostridiales bacterium]|nr:patatin family protein [Clostridiales bacterium]
MVGIIDVGGGTRGIYGCAVLDRCIDDGITVDYAVGVSAGSANCISFLANQKGRNYTFYTEYARRKEYMSLLNYIKTGSFLGLEYIYGTLTNSNGENPLDYETFQSSSTGFEVVATEAESGTPVYFKKESMEKDRYGFLMASCCVPLVCKPHEFNGRLYYDGGVSDPIPYKRAIEAGCNRIIVILTKPIDKKAGSSRNSAAASLLRHRYPNTAKALAECSSLYSRQLAEVIKLQQEGKALIIAPDNIGNLKTLSSDISSLRELYKKGYDDGAKIVAFL